MFRGSSIWLVCGSGPSVFESSVVGAGRATIADSDWVSCSLFGDDSCELVVVSIRAEADTVFTGPGILIVKGRLIVINRVPGNRAAVPEKISLTENMSKSNKLLSVEAKRNSYKKMKS